MKQSTGTIKIETERLILDKVMPTDFFSARKWLKRQEMAEFNLSKKPYSLKQTILFICPRFTHYKEPKYYFWGIRINNKMRGYVELMPAQGKENRYLFNFKLDPDLWGNGYMTEALTAIVEYAKTQEIETIYARCDAKNIGSKRAMEKAGLVHYKDTTTQYATGEKVPAYFFKLDL